MTLFTRFIYFPSALHLKSATHAAIIIKHVHNLQLSRAKLNIPHTLSLHVISEDLMPGLLTAAAREWAIVLILSRAESQRAVRRLSEPEQNTAVP